MAHREAPTGQENALLWAELRKVSMKMEDLEKSSKKKDEQIDELIRLINQKDAIIKEQASQLDEYARQITALNGGDMGERGKNIFQSMVAYVKKHPYLVATAVTAGVIGGFLAFWGVPVVWAAAAVTWKTAVAGGCVVGGATLLVGDVVVTEMDKKKLQ